MIEISVTGLQKSFDLEKKILDGLTFQINSGERVGLLGKNGAGKTTLFRILTGEIDYDAGEVAIASDRRVGLISQIPVYPAGYTVEDVLQSAFERMRRMADEMERLSAQMAKGDESEETLRRYGELSARFEGLGGYIANAEKITGAPLKAEAKTYVADKLAALQQELYKAFVTTDELAKASDARALATENGKAMAEKAHKLGVELVEYITKDDALEPGHFTDVKAGAYYEDAVKWAVDKAVTLSTAHFTASS